MNSSDTLLLTCPSNAKVGSQSVICNGGQLSSALFHLLKHGGIQGTIHVNDPCGNLTPLTLVVVYVTS
uniref:Uncharacterized protein n=1 Tax=Arundo donax TaxID=35708 RepID=A0A0A9FLY8_ARUDO